MLALLLTVGAYLPASPTRPALFPHAARGCKIQMHTDVTRRVLLGGACAALAASSPAPSFAAPDRIYQPAAGSLAGSTVLITGANTGLGLESAKRLTRGGARVIVTARSQQKADGAVAKVLAAAGEGAQVSGVSLDLASLESVRTLPARLDAVLGSGTGADVPAIDVLLNNAGVMAIPERLETSDGFERTVGVNHLGHFALVGVLAPYLKRAKRGFRVVTVSSDAHRFVNAKAMSEAIDADLDPAYTAWGSYGLSKAANVLFTLELQERIRATPGLRGSAVSLHPGVVQTDLARYLTGGVGAGDTRPSETTSVPDKGVGALLKKALDAVVLPVEKGANTQVYLAAAAEAGGDLASTPALYYDDMKATAPNGAASDAELAHKLWALSERLTGVKIQL